jgi:hypothetical protein
MLILDIGTEICKFIGTFTVVELYFKPLLDKLLEVLCTISRKILSIFKKIFNFFSRLRQISVRSAESTEEMPLSAQNDRRLVLSLQSDNFA